MRDVDGGAAAKKLVAGGKRVAVIFFSLKAGIAESTGIPKEVSKCLGELVVLLNQGLIIHLGEEGGALFILGRGWDEVDIGFQIKTLVVGEHLVLDISATAKGLLKEFFLVN